MTDRTPDAFVVISSPRKLFPPLLTTAAFTAATISFALVSGEVVMWVAAALLTAFLGYFIVARRPWSPSTVLTVTDSGVVPRRGQEIPWADVESVVLGRSGRPRRPALLIWVRPSAAYFTESSLIASIRRIGRRLLPGSPTFVVSSTGVSVPLERVMAEIATRSGEAWGSH